MLKLYQNVNLVLRVTMELGIVLAFGYWGFHTGKNESIKIILGISSPILIFGFWGLIDFHNAGSKAELLRLIQELILSGLAAAALIIAGQNVLGFTLAGLSIVHHSLVYILGDTLIKQK